MILIKTHKVLLPALILLLAILACGPVSLAPVYPTPAPRLPTEAPARATTRPGGSTAMPAADLADLLSKVSAERLIGDVKALSAIPSRHVNNPGVTEAAQYIEDQMAASGGNLQASHQGFPQAINGVDTFQRNVIATLPGSDPSAGIIVVGAHYDSRTRDIADSVSVAPGANDNATGTAIVIELARVFAASSPRATLIFVAFTGEEEGRLGSKYFVDAFSSHPDIRAMIALDIMGIDPSPDGSARLYSAGSVGSPSRRLAEFMAEQAPEGSPGFLVKIEDAADRPGRYSDHVSFNEAGYPAARFIQPEEDPSNHSADDTADRVNPEYMARATRAVLAGIYALAWGDARFAP